MEVPVTGKAPIAAALTAFYNRCGVTKSRDAILRSVGGDWAGGGWSVSGHEHEHTPNHHHVRLSVFKTNPRISWQYLHVRCLCAF